MTRIFRTIRQKPWLGYPLALLLFGLALLVRWSAGTAMDGLPFVTFFLAILAVAGLGGTGPAIACLLLSFVAAWYFFLPAPNSFRLVWPQGPIALAFFLAVGGAQIALIHGLRRATEHLAAQRMALAALAERHRLLYHEVQHRVANGIQAVSSALSVQASLSPEVQPALDEAIQRLLGVAEVHRRLHAPELGPRIAEMLDGMLRTLLVSAGKSDVAVTMRVEVGPLSPTTTSLIGLIVAEAASNSIKHAFAGRLGGSMEVSLLPVGAGHLRLIIEDDGPGFGVGDAGERQSLGTAIMEGLAGQLGGELQFGEGTSGGARLSLTFPHPDVQLEIR